MTAVLADVSYPNYGNTNTISATGTFNYNPVAHGQVTMITLTNATTVTFGAPTGIVEGAMFKFILKAGDTSNRSFAWSSNFKFPSGVAPLTYGTTNSGAYDIITFLGGPTNTLIYDGKVQDVR